VLNIFPSPTGCRIAAKSPQRSEDLKRIAGTAAD